MLTTPQQWETIYEDDFSAPEPDPEPESDDSDFEFDGVRTKKVKSKRKEREKKVVSIALYHVCLLPGHLVQISTKPVKDPTVRRRTHADSIPDSEKPFACDRESL